MKKRLMIFCDAYLPGERGGGGMWAVRNLAERFSDRYDFYIVTRDCDGRIDGTPYVKTPRNRWMKRAEAKVFYASPSNIKPRIFAELVEEVQPHAIYLNSVLSKPCVRFLIARRFYLKRRIPLLLATCGEFAPSAMQESSFKKHSFLLAGRACGLFQNIIWKATTEKERTYIKALMGDVIIRVAPELSPRDILPDFDPKEKPKKEPGKLRLVFFSRVTKIKNLDFLLSLLGKIESGDVCLDVIGPTDDHGYVEKCKQLADSLPVNIRVKFLGALPRDAALEIIKQSHFMTLPSKGENFGYVVVESLAAGCPVLLSDQTGWPEVARCGAGWRIPLTYRSEWESILSKCLLMDAEEYSKMSFSARDFAIKYLIADEPTAVNQLMFDSVLTVPYANG